MESLESFVRRLSESISCHYHPTHSVYALKKFNSNIKGEMGVFGWVSELKRKNLFRVDTYMRIGDKAGVSGLADGIKEGMHFNKDGTGIFFYVKNVSQGEDYQKTIKALRAIIALK